MSASSWFSKMLGTSMNLDNLENVLVMQMSDLASAEEQLVQALPKMAAAANSPELTSAFQTHLSETRQQKDRLMRAFKLLGKECTGETCDAMKGLISEGEEVISLEGDPDAKDAALIAAAQRVEHYEIAGYGCARTFARQLGHDEIADTLQAILDEEKATDEKLTELAMQHINEEAAAGTS